MYGENPTKVIQNQTVGFREEYDTAYFEGARGSNILDVLLDEQDEHTLKNFLERPRVLAKFVWSTNAIGGYLFSNHDIFQLVAASVQNHNKFQGFRYFKADIEITVQVNSQPFQQGGLVMWHIPVGAEDSSWNNHKFATAFTTASIRPATGFNSHVFNLMDAGTVKFKIPYYNPNPFIDICAYDQPSPMGGFYIQVYSPLVGGSVEGVVLGRFVDPQLVGPTDEGPNAVLGPPTASSEFQPYPHPTLIPTLEAQVENEATQMTLGQSIVGNFVKKPISTTLSVLSRASGIVSALVPPARLVAMPLMWVSLAASHAASFMGWSKPIYEAPPTVVKTKGARYMSNYNGIDTSDNMGLDATNSIVQAPIFGVDLDEMTFDYVISRFNYGARFSWTTTQDTGTVLATYHISPTMFDNVFVSNSETVYAVNYLPTQLGFVANHFQLWAGDISLQFRIFKTNFHSGRLRIKWKPGATAQPMYPDSSSLAYSVIWDVRTQYTTCVTIPYINEKPWLNVWSGIDQARGQLPVFNGTLTVEVLNELVATSTVSNSVDVVVEIRGEKGFSFAVPANPRFNNSYGIVPKDYHGLTYLPSLEAQVGDDSGMSPDERYITQKVNKRYFLAAESLTIGEAVVSFRQLLKRFTGRSYIPQNNVPRATNCSTRLLKNPNTTAVTLWTQYSPFGGPWTVSNEWPITPSTPIIATPTQDYVDNLFAIYALFRGSLRVKLLPALGVIGGSNPSSTLISKLFDNNDYHFHDTLDFINDSAPTVISDLITNPIHEVQQPFYWPSPALLTHHVDDDGWIVKSQFINYAIPGLEFTSQTSVNLCVFRALGDDASFHCLVGAPVLGLSWPGADTRM